MKRKILTLGASLLFLGMLGCTNPIGRAVDYVENGSRKAKPVDYKGVYEITDFKKQVEVYNNFVIVKIGAYETESTSYFIQEDKQVTHKVTRPFITYAYKDFNQDGHVDEYQADYDAAGRNIASVYSKVVWDKIYLPSVQNFNNTQKYADEELQNIINKDYKMLRQKGTRLKGKAYPPGGSWFKPEDYPIKMEEECPVKIEIKIN